MRLLGAYPLSILYNLCTEIYALIFIDSDIFTEGIEMEEKQKKAFDKQRKAFMLTINNPENHGYSHDKIIEIIHGFKHVQFFSMVDEIAPSSGTYHTHVLIVLKQKKRWSAIQNAFPGCHIEEEIRTTVQDVANYIKKSGKNVTDEKKETQVPGTYYEEGNLPKYTISNSKSEMLEQIQEMIDEGMRPEDIMSQHIAFRQFETLIKKAFFQKRFNETPIQRCLKFYYHVGESNTGKSYTYVQLCEKYPDDVFLGSDYSNRCTALFDEYLGQKIVILDEAKPNSIPYGMLLTLTDGYRTQIHCRYSNCYALYSEIHITSVFPPEELYYGMVDSGNQNTDSYKQLLRRITAVVYHYKKGGQYFTYQIPGSEYKSYDDLKERALSDGSGFQPVDEPTPFDDEADFMEIDPEDKPVFLEL